MACPNKQCLADHCCRLGHWGVKVDKTCPQCHELSRDTIFPVDCSLAPGMVCGRFGHYYEPDGIPVAVYQEAVAMHGSWPLLRFVEGTIATRQHV